MRNVLPTSVRYAGTYKGYLGKQEIRDLLLPDVRLVDEAAYLIAEAWDAHSNPTTAVSNSQYAFLNGLVAPTLRSDNEMLESVSYTHLTLPTTPYV